MKVKAFVTEYTDGHIKFVIGKKRKKSKFVCGSLNVDSETGDVEWIHLHQKCTEVPLKDKLNYIKEWVYDNDFNITSETNVFVRSNKWNKTEKKFEKLCIPYEEENQ